ncbi:MAG: type II toxin-antitoxin system VapC family toxin [Chloroflexota bacterium]|nr:type II toxin-antitoxin system VapC family toxin [Chloroflexota bacterium]
MSNVVIDTNIASYILKGDTRAAMYREHLRGTVALSFMTIAELYYWADIALWGIRKRAELQTFLQEYAILRSNEVTCRLWARIRAKCAQQGRPISVADAWVAACALRFDAPLVTHNRKDFEAVPDLRIISENG